MDNELSYYRYLHLEGFVEVKFDDNHPNDYNYSMYREVKYIPPQHVLDLITSIEED